MTLTNLIMTYLCGVAIAMVASRALASVPCGRCDVGVLGKCRHGSRWLTTILASLAWPFILAFSVVLIVRGLRRRFQGNCRKHKD